MIRIRSLTRTSAVLGVALGALLTFPAMAANAATTPAAKTATVVKATTVDPVTAKYNAMFGMITLGAPAGAVTTVAGGLVGNYQHGAIYWSSATGAHWMGTEIAKAYRAAGGPAGKLGFPTADQQFTLGALGGLSVGTVATFQHGKISYAAGRTVVTLS
jgi:uncharacterized protein with LGFP repeats